MNKDTITLTTIYEEMLKIRSDIRGMNERFEIYEENLKFANKEIDDLKADNAKLKKQQEFTSQQVARDSVTLLNLKTELETIKRKKMRKQVEILGLPESSNENLQSQIEEMATSVGLPINKTVKEIRRVGKTVSQQRPRKVVITFTSRIETINFLKKKKDLKSNLPRSTFINEGLTNEERDIFNATNEWRKARKYPTIFTKGGVTFYKKTLDSSPIKVLHKGELNSSPEISLVK